MLWTSWKISCGLSGLAGSRIQFQATGLIVLTCRLNLLTGLPKLRGRWLKVLTVFTQTLGRWLKVLTGSPKFWGGWLKVLTGCLLILTGRRIFLTVRLNLAAALPKLQTAYLTTLTRVFEFRAYLLTFFNSKETIPHAF